MALGGFGGKDKILTSEQLARWVSSNRIRFFLWTRLGNENEDLVHWVEDRCQGVSASVAPGSLAPGALFDCAAEKD